jgi:hypothetical protein
VRGLHADAGRGERAVGRGELVREPLDLSAWRARHAGDVVEVHVVHEVGPRLETHDVTRNELA